jgi:hypothetical protein
VQLPCFAEAFQLLPIQFYSATLSDVLQIRCRHVMFFTYAQHTYLHTYIHVFGWRVMSCKADAIMLYFSLMHNIHTYIHTYIHVIVSYFCRVRKRRRDICILSNTYQVHKCCIALFAYTVLRFNLIRSRKRVTCIWSNTYQVHKCCIALFAYTVLRFYLHAQGRGLYVYTHQVHTCCYCTVCLHCAAF